MGRPRRNYRNPSFQAHSSSCILQHMSLSTHMHGMPPPLRAMASVFLVPVFLPSNPAWHLPPFSSGSNLVQGSKKKRHRACVACVSAPNSMLPVCFPLLFPPSRRRRRRLAPLIAPQPSVRSLFSPFSSQRVRKGMPGEGGEQKKRGALRRAGIHQALKISFGFFFTDKAPKLANSAEPKSGEKKGFFVSFSSPEHWNGRSRMGPKEERESLFLSSLRPTKGRRRR